MKQPPVTATVTAAAHSRADKGEEETDHASASYSRDINVQHRHRPCARHQHQHASSSSSGSVGDRPYELGGVSAVLSAPQPSAVSSSAATCGLDRVSVLHGFLSTRAIPSLLHQTNYSRHELYSIFPALQVSVLSVSATGPDGIDAATFQRGVVRLSVEDERFVSRVFALVDADNSGSIEWEEFLVAMAALEKGSAEIKAKVRVPGVRPRRRRLHRQTRPRQHTQHTHSTHTTQTTHGSNTCTHGYGTDA